jgi:hypothetical protein
MTKPMIRIHDISTDEIIDREMTDDEYDTFLANQEIMAAENAKIEQAEADKAALLAKLGITADEAKLLLS